MHRNRVLLAVLVGLLGAAVSTAQMPNAMTLPDLFHKAKEQVKLGSWAAALATLEQIDTVSQRPGLEKDRDALLPPLAFYRGVCLAALDKEDLARAEFEVYLASSPNTRLDPAIYPKKVIASFVIASAGPGCSFLMNTWLTHMSMLARSSSSLRWRWIAIASWPCARAGSSSPRCSSAQASARSAADMPPR